MRTICAYQFGFSPPVGRTCRECLASVRDQVAGFLQEIYRVVKCPPPQMAFDGTLAQSHTNHEIWTNHQEGPEHGLVTLEWEFPDRIDGLGWQLSAALAHDGQSVQVALLVGAVTRTLQVRKMAFVFDRNNPLFCLPKFVGDLVDRWHGNIAGQPVPTRPTCLRENLVDSFVRDRLLHPDRVLPIVAVALEGGMQNNKIDLAQFQRFLICHAHVAVLMNAAAIARLSKLVGPERSLEGGGMRIYWPGFKRDDPPEAHHFQKADEVLRAPLNNRPDQILVRELVSIVADRFREGSVIHAARIALAQHVNQAPSPAVVDRLKANEAELEEQRQLSARLRHDYEEARQHMEALETELIEVRQELAIVCGHANDDRDRPPSLEELAVELERAWDENKRLQNELELAQLSVVEMEGELKNFQENWGLMWGSHSEAQTKTPEPSKLPERAFTTVAEALRAAGKEFADILVVWDDAVHSAEASLFSTPAQAFRALEAVAEVGRVYFEAKSGGPALGPLDRAFRRRVPFKYTGFESQTTLGKFGADRVFHHGQLSKQMQRHLTMGGGTTNNCLQIYFDFDEAAHRVLIGYCGRHLRYSRGRT